VRGEKEGEKNGLLERFKTVSSGANGHFFRPSSPEASLMGLGLFFQAMKMR